MAQYIYKNYKVGQEFVVFGRPTIYQGRFQFAHPEMERASDLQLSEMGMQPYYTTTERMKKMGITSRVIEKTVKNMLLQLKDPLPETLPTFITKPLHLVSRDEAMRCVHYPKTPQQMKAARDRLKFEEPFSATSCVMPQTIVASIAAMYSSMSASCLTTSIRITSPSVLPVRRSE